MKKILTIALLVPFVATVSCGEFGGKPKAKVTVRVVDDEGEPVPGANVAVLGSFGHLQAPLREGLADEEGLFTAELACDSTLSFQAEAEGFHSVLRMYYAFSGGKQARKTGRWEPWNPTVTVSLRKKGNPVPMFVHWVRGEPLPKLDEPVGYDLLLGDWVEPYGLGTVGDLVLTGSVSVTNLTNYSGSLEVKFPGRENGLILRRQPYTDSYGLLLSSMAPEFGYTNRWHLTTSTRQPPGSRFRYDEDSFSRDDNYYFRIRSKLNDAGGITSAMYGKIYWGIHFFPRFNSHEGTGPNSKRGTVEFLYYVNPDGTRNTEFDVTQNLNTSAGNFAPRP